MIERELIEPIVVEAEDRLAAVDSESRIGVVVAESRELGVDLEDRMALVLEQDREIDVEDS